MGTERVNLATIYRSPEIYRVPENEPFKGSTEHPNLNSIEYRILPADREPIEPFYEILTTNGDQTTTILAANSYTGRVWDGSLFLFDRLNDVVDVSKSTFRQKFDSSVCCLQFINQTTFLTGDCAGSLQLWSTQKDLHKSDSTCLYNVAKVTECLGAIKTFALVEHNGARKIVTGSSDCSIKLWDIGECQLVSERTMRYAHTDDINCIANKPTEASIYCSSSNDRSFSVWDLRIARPVVAFHENHDVAFTSCLWTNETNIFVGDEAGKVFAFDVKNLNEPIETIDAFDRAVHRLQWNDERLSVTGNTNEFAVYDAQAKKLREIYRNSSANDYVRDICWSKTKSPNKNAQFYSVGFNKHVKFHQIK